MTQPRSSGEAKPVRNAKSGQVLSSVRVSVIIPTLNEAAGLPRTLRSLPDEVDEVIVADGGSTDGTRRLARAWGAEVVRSPRGRARQLNAGAARASGTVLYFLHADTLAPPRLGRYADACVRTGVPACFRLCFGDHGGNPWLRLFAYLSRYGTDLFRFGDQSLLVLATEFRAVGGYREDHALLEGHDLVRRLRKRRGFRVHPERVVTSARRYHRHGVLFTQAVFVLIVVLYYLGAGQRSLGRLYRYAFSGTKVGTTRRPSADHSSNW